MSKNYTQLCLEQRYKIEALKKAGLKQKEIALQIGVHASTICRELKRNVAKRGQTSGEYLARIAAKRSANRHSQKHKRVVLNDSMKQIIVNYLQQEHWSPELISKCAPGVGVSPERIYQWIWECKHQNRLKDRRFKTLYRYLKHGKRRRKRGNTRETRGILLNRVGIENRPKVVAKRKRLGDYEVDLMMGKNHQSALLVIVDRATLHTRLALLPDKASQTVLQGLKSSLKKNKFNAKTITFDNDKAFSCHEQIGKFANATTYFTRPYTSQDKGTVENRIGVIRRFFPKKTDLNLITKDQIKEVELKLNKRPIRKFNYLNANQVLRKKIALIN